MPTWQHRPELLGGDLGVKTSVRQCSNSVGRQRSEVGRVTSMIEVGGIASVYGPPCPLSPLPEDENVVGVPSNDGRNSLSIFPANRVKHVGVSKFGVSEAIVAPDDGQ
jgi:hypothetical protein